MKTHKSYKSSAARASGNGFSIALLQSMRILLQKSIADQEAVLSDARRELAGVLRQLEKFNPNDEGKV